jgi:chromosome segregation ATPase
MTNEIDINSFYIVQLESSVQSLTKDKIIQATNIDILNKLLEEKDKKISEIEQSLSNKDAEIDQAHNTNKTHQSMINVLEIDKKDLIIKFDNAMNEVRVLQTNLNDIQNKFSVLNELHNDLEIKYENLLKERTANKKQNKTTKTIFNNKDIF